MRESQKPSAHIDSDFFRKSLVHTRSNSKQTRVTLRYSRPGMPGPLCYNFVSRSDNVEISISGLELMHSLARKLAVVGVLSFLTFAGGCTGFFVNPTLSSIAIGPTGQTITVSPRTTLQMTATGTFSDGSTKDLTGKVLWDSSDTTCATINSTGLVSPATSVTGICTTTISASMGTVNASTASVTVTEGTPLSIQLTASTTTPQHNSTVTFTAKATFANSGTPQDITNSVTWNVSDTTNLTLTNGSGTGTLSAGSAGLTITVTATFDGVASNTVTLNVQ
jgi:trimeric autotransporter adhesin